MGDFSSCGIATHSTALMRKRGSEESCEFRVAGFVHRSKELNIEQG